MKTIHLFGKKLKLRRWVLYCLAALLLACAPMRAGQQEESRWLLGQAHHIPSEYTNQESGYFSIVAGHDSRVYVGAAKYGVNAYLIEFNPMNAVMRLVMDVHRVIMQFLTGFAAQAKIHTRNNVGQLTGKIYVGSKQGYPEKGEKRSDYPGGYVLAYDPKTGTNENFGMPKKHHGVISVMPDEHRGLIYVSTCDDGRPIEHSHFMVYDMKKKTYKDLGDSEHHYAFIVLDHKGRAYHPVRGGKIFRYDPDADKLETLTVTVDGQPCPKEIIGLNPKAHASAILNWDASPDGKTLWCVEMSHNMLYSFDLTAAGSVLPGKSHGPLLAGKNAKGNPRITDCRAMCVGPTGKVWAAVTEHGIPQTQLYLVSYTPGHQGVRNHGKVGVANPDFTPFVDAKGKPLPWHHGMRKEKDGTMTPTTPMGVCEARDGNVYVLTIGPFTLIKYRPDQVK
ncbi:MAG: SMP-30/gluconolactonase/LRE family protein [Gemmataceae bacterium]|nr:SMP-30/gluconolactonase/LRE family protein [Gemmataceae bacterium]